MKTSCCICLVLVLAVAIPGQVNAQGKRTSRDTAAATGMVPSGAPNMAAIMDSIGPMFQTVMGGMYGGVVDYLARPETATKLAAFTRNYFDELIKRGFSREEALSLARGVGIPGLPFGR